jgi:hypothetical protein
MVVGVVLFAAAAACSSGSSGGSQSNTQPTVALMAGFDPGPAPDPSVGFQIVTPIVDNIAPGGSDEYCTWTNIILPADVWVNATEGFQTETGHHVVLFYATNPQPVDTHLCGTEEMAEFQFGMPGSGKAGLNKVTLPGNLAVRLPAGAQMVVNHHYLNASATNVPQAQSALNVYYADPSTAHTPAGLTLISDTAMSIPVGVSTYTIDCTVNQPYAAWMQVPHMHSWGQHITITDTPAATGVPQRLFDLDWNPDYAFDPSIATREDPSTPFMLQTGDKIHVQCDYNNTTNEALPFGSEMCMFVTFTVDSNNTGNTFCDRGQWGQF